MICEGMDLDIIKATKDLLRKEFMIYVCMCTYHIIISYFVNTFQSPLNISAVTDVHLPKNVNKKSIRKHVLRMNDCLNGCEKRESAEWMAGWNTYSQSIHQGRKVILQIPHPDMFLLGDSFFLKKCQSRISA